MTDSDAHPVPGNDLSSFAATTTGATDGVTAGSGIPATNGASAGTSPESIEAVGRHENPGDDAAGEIDPDTAAAETGGAERTDADEPEAGKGSFWRELPFLIVTALVIAVLIKTFAFQAFYIPSSSMEDTLEINDRVLVNKIEYGFSDIARGDVIVFDDPNGDASQESIVGAFVRNLAESVGLSTPKSEFIKRVIGLPGDEILIKDGQVHINGEAQDEPYLHPSTDMPDFGPVTVEEGYLFMMGDNRNSSQDSRFFGTVDADTVVGRAFVILWPPSRWSGL